MIVQGHLPKKEYHFAVIDNEEAVYYGLRALIEAEGGHCVDFFDSPEAFLNSGKPQEFDCILLDLCFPGGMDGMQLLIDFARQQIKTPVVMITAENKASPATMFELGSRANAFLLKPFHSDKLWEALRKAMHPAQEGASNGEPPEPPIPAKVFQHPESMTRDDYEKLRHHASSRNSLVYLLTFMEMKVFLLIAEGKSNKDIAKVLCIEVCTATTHRTSVYRKLKTRKLLELRDLRDDLKK